MANPATEQRTVRRLVKILNECLSALQNELDAAKPYKDHPVLMQNERLVKRARKLLTKVEGI